MNVSGTRSPNPRLLRMTGQAMQSSSATCVFVLAVVLATLLLTACGSSVDPAPASTAPTPTSAAAAYLTPTAAIEPVQFPNDEAPHDMLTEWWYYTGHLVTEDGTRYGFEYVIFQALRGAFPPITPATSPSPTVLTTSSPTPRRSELTQSVRLTPASPSTSMAGRCAARSERMRSSPRWTATRSTCNSLQPSLPPFTTRSATSTSAPRVARTTTRERGSM